MEIYLIFLECLIDNSFLFLVGGMMNNILIEDVIGKIREYNEEAIPMVKKAFNYASLLHHGQYRKSGDEYIVHPLNVAYILCDMHMDCATICAGFLHDTIEDTKVTKQDIEDIFGSEIARLVDGVTKMGEMEFLTKNDQILSNIRKQILGITSDIRIILVKLADRLHNMRTLQFMEKEKQLEIGKISQFIVKRETDISYTLSPLDPDLTNYVFLQYHSLYTMP